jgi:RNA polymerase sigma-70 factor (ECF subfamily)
MSSEDAQAVRAALERLPDEQRALVNLAYYEGLTHSEIAALTGVPLGTIKTRLRAAMTTLRGVLT